VTRGEEQAQWAKFYAQLTADQKRVTDDIMTRAPDNSGGDARSSKSAV
jgi:hypothetical protein